MSQMTEKGLRLPRVRVCLRCRLSDLGDQKELDLLFWTVQSLCSTQSLFVLRPEAALSHLTRPDWQAGPEEWGKHVVCGWSKQALKAASNRSAETRVHTRKAPRDTVETGGFTWGAPGVSRTRSGSSQSSLSKALSKFPQVRTGPHRSASSLEVSSRWLALASSANDTANRGTSLRMGPRLSSESCSLMWGKTARDSPRTRTHHFRTLRRLLQSYRHFLRVCMLKVFLHDRRDRLFKVPLIQREDQRLIHAVFLSKHHLGYRQWLQVPHSKID